jgi:hypothetical protein
VKIKTHQGVAGVPSSTDVEVDDKYGDWLVAQGYAVKVDEKDKRGAKK